MSAESMPTISPEKPVWVDGIGPPLQQIEEDYMVQSSAVARDIGYLIREIYRLRRECPFCLWSGERYDLAVHLEDCPGRRGYLGR